LPHDHQTFLGLNFERKTFEHLLFFELHAYGHSHCYPNGHTYCDRDSHSHTYTDADTYTNCDRDTAS
jgi:hypothetical protein